VGGDTGHRLGGDRTPEIVDHDVDITCRLSEFAYRSVVAELNDGVGAQLGKGREPRSVASGSDDMAGAKVFGDLHGHATRASGCAEDQHRLAGFEVDAPPKGDPRGHDGVHRRGHQDGVGAVGKHHTATLVDDGLLGHRTHGGVGQDEVADRAVGRAAHSVDAGDQR
jgi:hypothetical protein